MVPYGANEKSLFLVLQPYFTFDRLARPGLQRVSAALQLARRRVSIH